MLSLRLGEGHLDVLCSVIMQKKINQDYLKSLNAFKRIYLFLMSKRSKTIKVHERTLCSGFIS